MKGLVFMNPWVLFVLYWGVGIFAGLATIVAAENITTVEGLIGGFVASLTLVCVTLFWPHAVYKLLASQDANTETWKPKFFDWPVIFIVLGISVAMVMGVYFEAAEISKPYYLAIETFGGVLVLAFFTTLFSMFWSIARMLKGGIGWCIVLFYWPLLASFVQKEIRQLYPTQSVN